MSEQAFERLLYTDCRPGEGLKGGPGYQVQAQSPGVSAAQSAMAIKWLLYETQTPWVNDGRPVADFPKGLAHAAAAGFATSQGMYVGKEANGFRQGNFLSDCILTEESAPYGIIRPAQLWQAAIWRTEIWPSTTAAALDRDVDFGPIDFDAVKAWLLQGNDRALGLTRLLTVLEDPEGPRVAIKAAYPEQALFWIAAATILLPIEEALAVSFSVFVRSHDRTPHRIVALPADLNPNLSPGGSNARLFVIDAGTDATDEIESSERASFWVRQLVAAEEPYEVVEAVETAARYAGRDDQETADARAAAMTVCAPDWSIEDAPGVGRWVQRSFGTVFEEDAKSVIARLVDAEDVRLTDLRLLDHLASGGLVSVNTAELRGRLFDGELADLQVGGLPPFEKLPDAFLDRARLADQGSAVVSAMLLSSNAEVARLLGLAWRHGLTLSPPTPALVDRIRTMVAAWVAAPTQKLPLAQWALADLITDELHQQVRGVFESRDEGQLKQVLPPAASYLVNRGNDLGDAFTMELEACYTAQLARPGDRLARIRQVLQSMRSGPELWYDRYQTALVKWIAADTAACVELVSRIPVTYALDATVLKLATNDLLKRVHQDALDSEVLQVVEALRERDQLPEDSRVRRIAASAATVNDFIVVLEGHQQMRDYGVLVDHLTALQKADEEVLQVSMPAFAAVAAESLNGTLGQSILRYLRKNSGVHFCENYAAFLSEERTGHTHAVRMFVWMTDTDIPEDVRRSLVGQLVGHYRGLSEGAASDWRRIVANNLPYEDDRTLFEEMLGTAEKATRRRGRLWGKE